MRSMKRAACAAGVVAFALTGIASAIQDQYPNSHVGVDGFYIKTDKKRDGVKHGSGVSLSMAWRLSDTLSLAARGFANTLQTDQQTLTNFYQQGLGLDLVQTYGDESHAHLYGLIGAGALRDDVVPHSKRGVNGYGNAAIGWRFAPLINWDLRPRIELRTIYDTFDGHKGDIALGIGFDILPRKDRVVEKVVEKEKIVEKVVEKIVEKPVEKIVEVVKEVAPVDSDGDGVPDSRDKCPNTPPGTKVDADGCAIPEQSINLPNVEFLSGKTALTEKGQGALDAIVKFLQSQPNAKCEVVGHTDGQGKDDYNLKLSQGRAKAVVDYLVSQGVEKSRLSSSGKGKREPIASNETKEGRAKNRRVELKIKTK